ncbi:MAG: ABC transporter substrate-binding protein [Solirubrobacterales bacterium]
MRTFLVGSVVIGLVLAAGLIAGCGRSAQTASSTAAPDTPSSVTDLDPMTPAAGGETGKVTWALYRPVQTLDPVHAIDYPENTVISAMCESVLRQEPDGSIGPGLATLTYEGPTRLVLKLQPGATFWDGEPVTAADIAWSLERNLDPAVASFYLSSFEVIGSMTPASKSTLKIRLKHPDYEFEGELSSTGAVVLEKAYSAGLGKSLGAPGGSIMCSGAYKLGDWNGEVLTLVRQQGYWGGEKAKAQEIDFRGVPDEAALTAGLKTGEISGVYTLQLPTIDELKADPSVKVYEGSSYATAAFAISNLEGVLGDVEVRRALSLAFDRHSYIEGGFKGTAIAPRTFVNPGTWGYGRKVFEADWNKLPEPEQDVAAAKKLIEEAGAAGQTLTIGMSNEISAISTAANAVRAAAESIGLKVRLKSVSAPQFIGFFSDPKAREGLDGFPTISYPGSAEPANLYGLIVMPNGLDNFDGFSDPRMQKDLEKARRTADPDARAELVTAVGDRFMEQLPWIPLVLPRQQLVLNKELTGVPTSFVYLFAPWANGLGAAG